MFPSKALPNHAVFVKHRISRVARHAKVKVIVPVPYFPFTSIIKRYSFRKNIPRKDIIDGLEVYYPRFLSIPHFLKPLDGVFIFLSCLFFVNRRLKAFKFDVIDSHLAYPDGFGAVLLGKLFNKPVSITLRGHDINHTPQYPVRFKQIKYALKKADQIFSVAKALKDQAVKFGADADKIFVTCNGVNTEVFRPLDKQIARKQLGLPADKRIIVSVGNLVERKGFQILLQALRRLIDKGYNDLFLVIVGGPGEEGNYLHELERLIGELALSDSVLMAGSQQNSDLPAWYSAAEFSCLASEKEGWANVLLESLACGRPVVATNVWGTPEVISSSEYGILTERDSESLANALQEALNRKWNHTMISAYASQYTWDDIASKIIIKFKETVNNH
jgi:glycosyltransferase involved in cell wall biosynthesis